MSKNNSKIIWEKSDGRKKLFTVIPKSENQANQYRNWNPFYSKLAAALFNGLEIFPFKSDSKIFYSGSSSTTTLNHLLDIIDSKGIIYLQKNNSTKIKNLKNVVIVDQEKNYTLVLDKTQLLMVAKTYEFSDEVIAVLNERLPVVSIVPPEELTQ